MIISSNLNSSSLVRMAAESNIDREADYKSNDSTSTESGAATFEDRATNNENENSHESENKFSDYYSEHNLVGDNIGYFSHANADVYHQDYVTITGNNNYISTLGGRDQITNNGKNIIEAGSEHDIIYSGANASGSVYNGGADSDYVVFQSEYSDAITIESVKSEHQNAWLLTIPNGPDAGTYTVIDIERIMFSGDDWDGKAGKDLMLDPDTNSWAVYDREAG